VTKADGTKFGKTESGTIWLDAARTSPYRLYQFFFNTEDAIVGQYLRYFTFLTHDEITALDAQTTSHPHQRAAQRALAREVCALVHGTDEVERAERASVALFGEEISDLDEATLLDVVADAPSSVLARTDLEGDGAELVGALVSSSLVSSRSEGRRAITQGGVYVNNRKETDERRSIGPADLLHDRYVVLRRGRRDYHVLRVE
jgi:tyrosyl-tRNA synthetase